MRTRSLLLLCLLLVRAYSHANESAIPADQLEFFESRIRPLLAEKCYGCHSAEAKKLKGELFLDSRDGWMRGGETGPVIVPGKPRESRLVQAVTYLDPDLLMPPRKKLSDAEITDLTRWVELGAPDPRTEKTVHTETKVFDLEARRRSHWAWQPIQSRSLPEVKQRDWPRTGLDYYILSRLEAAKLEPAPPADRTSWLRRVTFDLTGLPPGRAEIDAFLSDDSPQARERVVDRLLASPRFGEHWAQHWLDLMRFAETCGHEGDYEITGAYEYRDYVVRALNADVPYDRFVTEHVAGDLVQTPRLDYAERTNESIKGTGFWHLGEATHSPVDIRGEEAERFANRLDVFGKAFLGLTLGCVRCHDHKFDAISARDYYALFGYLQSSSYHLADVSDPEAQTRAHEKLATLTDEHLPRIVALQAKRFEARLGEMRRQLVTASTALGKLKPREGFCEPPEKQSADKKAPSREETIAEVAESFRVDTETLKAWLNQLEAAKKDLNDPFHIFAVFSLDEGDLNVDRLAVLTSELAGRIERAEKKSREAFWSRKTVRTREEGERNYVRTERPLVTDDILVDYGQPGPHDWITFGHGFGDQPAVAGEVLLGDSSEKAIAEIFEQGTAASERLSDRFPGLLRTRTFEVTSDTLWYRYRGKASVFLAVDSHRVIYGPLHAVVKKQLEGDDHYRWASHDVSDYIGHRVHVEFRAEDGFALTDIQYSSAAPPDLWHANRRILGALEGAKLESMDDLAALYETVFRDTVREFATARRLDPDGARIVNWLIESSHRLEISTDDDRGLEDAFTAYARKRAALEGTIPAPILAPVLIDGTGEDEPIHLRGQSRTLSSEGIPRRFLEALGDNDSTPPANGSGRLGLARRMVAPTNPLTPRVLVNRLWHHLFERGIVQTVDDFGAMGQEPTHPELLDYLASELVRRHWSMKDTLREILLSRTYGMSSRPTARGKEIDPTNALVHRMPIRRLGAESIRDSIMAISGRLDTKMFGPGVRVHITDYMRSNRSPDWSGPMDSDGRRSLYIEVRRNHLSHFLTTFDRPIPFATRGRRGVSNSPAQPLILMNDPFVHEQAEVWAWRLLALKGLRPDEIVEKAYYDAFGRPPTDLEIKSAERFIKAQRRIYDEDAEVRAWSDFCHTLMNVKEFIFLK